VSDVIVLLTSSIIHLFSPRDTSLVKLMLVNWKQEKVDSCWLG